MNKWPRTIPYDLRCRLETLLEYRDAPSIQTQWGTILEWLEHHGVTPPDHALPVEPELKGPVGHS
ncbi:hypothetical protein GS636_06795 [Ruegeria sp. HKCCD4884]|uniref:hypothetical protein n=1 Tax=Ruegeria sp. HKCCD4884 TaxID=2683022 RepID=UPI00149184EB|nr:hypothetical protein [Ruegeria sp. HKCCD4884]NOD92489.1 hypothetical protein [Ruegeria sp. HKCCD4884]